MPFYELVFEDGTHSVACYEDQAEALGAIKEAHSRASSGEPSMPGTNQRAVRIIRVLEYDVHPDDFNPDQMATADEVLARVKDVLAAKGDVVNLNEVANDVRAMADPLTIKESPHDSLYKMAEAKELDAKEWS